MSGTVVVVILLMLAGFFVYTKSKRKGETNDEQYDPYHLNRYGLADLVEGDLRVGNKEEGGFETSNFRLVKDALTKRLAKVEGLNGLPLRYVTDAVKGLIMHRIKDSAVYNKEFDRLMLQTEVAMQHNDEHAEDGAATAEMLWTSARKVEGKSEICSIVNAAIREDDPSNIVHAVVFARAIELRRDMRNNFVNNPKRYPNMKARADMFPQGHFPDSLKHHDWVVCWRGGGFNNCFQDFFADGKYYRCPGIIATSLDTVIPRRFAQMCLSNNQPATLWGILLDGRGANDSKYRCKHASFVSKTHCPGEDEFLFSPYSVFQVLATKWSPQPTELHVVMLRAALDNRNYPKDLPLTPWY